MFSEKSKLVEKRENPFYGSYKENNILEEIHWQNKRRRQQLAMVAAVILILVLLSIGITLAITLPPLLDRIGNHTLDPADPDVLLNPSPSILRQFTTAGVSSESGICSDIGRDIMQNSGGNSVDAAIAVTLCHGVTNPQSSGLGGGLFMVIYTGNETFTVNARETAPANVDLALYEEDSNASLKGGLAVGIPGELAGLWEAHQKFGKVQWSELVKPSQELAQNGFAVSSQLAKSLKENKEKIIADPILSSEFLNGNSGEVWLEGEILKRPRLAATLLKLEQSASEEFYNGTLSADIVQEITKAKGIITLDDLSSYRVEWDPAIEMNLTGNLTMYAMSFPSSGPVIALALAILHGFGRKHPVDMDAKATGLDEHQLVEVLKFAHTHRALIADPNFSDMTEVLENMLDSTYADELRAKIDPYKTFEDPMYYGGVYAQSSDAGTSHISIIGPDGDAVSLTTTINLGFGAGFMGDATGIIYNNQMNDFVIGNASDIYGLPPNQLNGIEPGKRPASSMAPLIFVNSKGLPVFATGGSDGENIVSSVISTTWRALYRDSDIKNAIDHPRLVPNFNPSELIYEYGLPSSTVAELKRRGHKMTRIDNYTSPHNHNYIGNVNAVCRTKRDGIILTNADYRKHGDSAGF